MTMSRPDNVSHSSALTARAQELLTEHQQRIYTQTDRIFAVLLLCQWVAGILAAWWISPRTWVGTSSQIHLHVWLAVLLGGALNLGPAFFAFTKPGTLFTRQAIAIGQALTSALWIHLTGGRIETHFFIFGSLAFLTAYRDWRVIVTMTALVAVDHAVRGLLWSQSVFGLVDASPWRWVEHAGWVIFEDIVLLKSIWQSQRDMRDIAEQQATLENELTERGRIEEQLRQQAQQVANGTGQLTVVTHAITTSVQQMMAAVTATASSMTQTATSVVEVKQTASEASRQAHVVSESAQRTAEVSYDGAQAVDEALAGMARMHEHLQAIVGRVSSLGERTEAIGEIISTVNDVAEQSNLLAVNAAIEAAKAGDSGKGFAVVAAEVKTLATQSKQATTQIRSLLQQIQQAVHGAVSVTEQGLHAVESGRQQAVTAGASIQTLSTMTKEAAQAVAGIASASAQQAAGMDQVAIAIETIRATAQQHVDGLRQIEQAMSRLQHLEQDLSHLTGRTSEHV